jgi:phosphoglycolate phosphatase-like HAD superfamily hydrolase
MKMDYQSVLKDFKPSHDFFIGIDSDGCVFDTMEVKQKEFFIPNGIKYFDLFAMAKIVRETWEFVNLYSVYRGANRFLSLIKVFELLKRRREIIDSGIRLPDLTSLKEWVRKETKLGNATLRKYFDSNYDPDLEKVVRWTEAVNKDISDWLHDIAPFPYARKSIEKINSFADTIVVSQTPLEALEREWEEHDLKKYVSLIAGQEHGTKAEQIAFSGKGKYTDVKILMIGDANGDLDAAKSNGVLFFPVIPGKEDLSWKRFLNEGLEKFLTGKFAGSYEENLLIEFRRSLPEIPLWERG